jgi:hypothetical protein
VVQLSSLTDVRNSQAEVWSSQLRYQPCCSINQALNQGVRQSRFA